MVNRLKFFANGLAYSFPIQLLAVHVKKNQFILLFWFVLFVFIFKGMGMDYGVPFLFLDPEYLDKVSFWSYLIVGFSCGGFVMAFNIASYIMNAFRFPFLATMARPFFKYCLNNFILPLSFTICYCVCIEEFHRSDPDKTVRDIIFYVGGFLLGEALFILFTLTYFLAVLKDFRVLFGMQVFQKYVSQPLSKTRRRRLNKNMEWSELKETNVDSDKYWRVDTYLSDFFTVSLTRNTEHYDHAMLQKVFRQNHFMAVIYVFFIIITILTFGFFREYPYFEIPAAASIFLMITMVLMALSALNNFFKGWSFIVFGLSFLLLNYFSTWEFMKRENAAYGLNYQGDKPIYTTSSITTPLKHFKQDYLTTIEILDKWRKKNSINTIKRRKKPKIVFINTSGGGLRSSLWTFYAAQVSDSLLGGELLQHTALISGSSGGMIGMAYLRELYLRKQLGEISSYYDEKYANDVALDLLNPVAFSITVNDLFIRLKKFKVGSKEYRQDRAYAFEKQLNENTRGYMDRKLWEYRKPEQEALIPMLVVAPSIINDGRTLYISPLDVSYLLNKTPGKNVQNKPLPDGVEFRRMFENQDADSLLFSSALRMNATFPYILPVVSLPGNPAMDIMDAGINDNYGLNVTMRFLHTFRNWISSNTSGVIIIQFRDCHKLLPIEENPPRSLVEHLTNPLGNIYGNLFNIMDFQQDGQVQAAGAWFEGNIEVIDFQLRSTEDFTQEEISMSLHLTNREKARVKNSILLPENQNAITRLKQLLQ